MKDRHFFIEIVNQKQGFAFKAGILETLNRSNYRKKYLAETADDFDVFYQILEENYHQNTSKNKADLLVYIHGLWGDRRGYFANNLHQSDVHYVQNLESSVAFTLSIIWHTHYPSYWYCQKKCKIIAENFAPFFWKNTLKMQEMASKTTFLGKMHLLCHSMGNYFFENMLVTKPQTTQPIFQEIVLAAADVDADFMEKQDAVLKSVGHEIVVLNNRKDRLLWLSKWANWRARLGNQTPQYFDEKKPNFRIIEVSKSQDVRGLLSRLNQHAHYHASYDAISQLNCVFKKHQKENLPIQ